MGTEKIKFGRGLKPRLFPTGFFMIDLFYRQHEQHKADDKQEGDGDDAIAGVARELGDNADEQGAGKGRALAENVVKAKVLGRFLLGDDLGKIGAGQSLDSPLKDSDTDRQKPEFPRLIQLNGKEGDEKIADDPNADQLLSFDLFREPAKQEREGEGHDLGEQQSHQQVVVAHTHIFTIGGCHFDDGVDTVDVEEKRHQEQHNVFILTDIFNGMAQAHKALFYRIGHVSHRKFLLITSEQRDCHQHPPHRGDDKGNGRCQLGTDANASGKEHQEHAGRKGYTAADIAKGVAHA